MHAVAHLNPVRQIEAGAGEYRGQRGQDHPEDAQPCHLIGRYARRGDCTHSCVLSTLTLPTIVVPR